MACQNVAGGFPHSAPRKEVPRLRFAPLGTTEP
jgi:hypothetical protein